MFNLKKLDAKGETSVVQTVMIALLIVAAFFIGMLWTKVQNYEKGTGNVIKPNPIAKGTGPTLPTGEGMPEAEVERNVKAITADDFIRGNKNARIANIEWSDLECPFCKSFHPTMQQALETYGNDLMWVYRHFPLDQLHPKARNEAAAAECAAKQGGETKFWAFVDRVYEITPANNGLDAAKLPEIAKELGLNVATFNTCLTSQEAKDAVQADFDAGLEAGITGTPGSLLYDTKTGEYKEIPGAVPFETLKTYIENFKASLK